MKSKEAVSEPQLQAREASRAPNLSSIKSSEGLEIKGTSAFSKRDSLFHGKEGSTGSKPPALQPSQQGKNKDASKLTKSEPQLQAGEAGRGSNPSFKSPEGLEIKGTDEFSKRDPLFRGKEGGTGSEPPALQPPEHVKSKETVSEPQLQVREAGRASRPSIKSPEGLEIKGTIAHVKSKEAMSEPQLQVREAGRASRPSIKSPEGLEIKGTIAHLKSKEAVSELHLQVSEAGRAFRPSLKSPQGLEIKGTSALYKQDLLFQVNKDGLGSEPLALQPPEQEENKNGSKLSVSEPQLQAAEAGRGFSLFFFFFFFSPSNRPWTSRGQMHSEARRQGFSPGTPVSSPPSWV